MAIRPFSVLMVVCIVLAAACQPADRSAGAEEATASPAEDGAAATALPDATRTMAAPATPSPVPSVATPPPDPTTGTGDSAADADVVFVRAAETPDDSWTFRVTVAHPDTGWDDYADGWDVVTPDGTVLKPNPDDAFTRVLLHPHENEQPFTRSQRGIVIPDGVTTITVRAHDSVDGFGGREVQVDLEASSGSDFEVERQP